MGHNFYTSTIPHTVWRNDLQVAMGFHERDPTQPPRPGTVALPNVELSSHCEGMGMGRIHNGKAASLAGGNLLPLLGFVQPLLTDQALKACQPSFGGIIVDIKRGH